MDRPLRAQLRGRGAKRRGACARYSWTFESRDRLLGGAAGRGRADARDGHGRRGKVLAMAIVDRVRRVDPHLCEIRLVDLDLGLTAELVDEVLLRRKPLLAEELVADDRLGVLEALRERLAATGLLEDVERAVAGVDDP